MAEVYKVTLECEFKGENTKEQLGKLFGGTQNHIYAQPAKLTLEIQIFRDGLSSFIQGAENLGKVSRIQIEPND